MPAVAVDGLGKCYRLGKQRLAGLEGLGQLLSVLGLGREKKELARDLWALADVSFSVDPGEVFGIIGRNGAGKSTLLKILARITLPTTGRAVIRGRVVSLLELGAGFHPELTGRENIFLNAAFYGIAKDEVARQLDEIVAFAELEKFIDTPVRHYSSGMYIRLAFSNAIHMRPDVLLADEVLAVGDLHFQRQCMDKMREISHSGVTVLFVSHDMEAIERLCNRCIRLDKGGLVDMGAPLDVIERYRRGEAEQGQGGKTPGHAKAAGKGVLAGKHGAFVDVMLTSTSGRELAAVRTSQEVDLVAHIRVEVPNAWLFVSFDVTVNGAIAFRAAIPSNFHCPSPGVYAARARIPQHLLAEISYTVNAGARIIVDEDNTTLVCYEALVFKVYDVGDEDSARGDYTGRLPGLVSPRLAWSVAPVIPESEVAA